jgi:hypothetical protein
MGSSARFLVLLEAFCLSCDERRSFRVQVGEAGPLRGRPEAAPSVVVEEWFRSRGSVTKTAVV